EQFALEKFFSNAIEDKAVPVLDQIANGPFPPKLTQQQLELLAIFTAFQRTRVPTFRDHAKRIYELLMTDQMQMHARNKGNFEADAIAMELENGEKINRELLEEVRQRFERRETQIEADQGISLMPMLNIADLLISVFLSMAWRFCKSDGDEQFITSDNPVAMTDTGPLGGNLLSPTAEFLFPLSDKIILHLSRRRGVESAVVGQELVRSANWIQAKTAQKHVFTSTRASALN